MLKTLVRNQLKCHNKIFKQKGDFLKLFVRNVVKLKVISIFDGKRTNGGRINFVNVSFDQFSASKWKTDCCLGS